MADGIGYSGTLFCLAAVYIGTFADHIQLGELKKSVKTTEEIVSALQPQLHTENVLGGPELESFYVIGGQKLYVTVDGKAVGDYFPLQAEKGTK